MKRTASLSLRIGIVHPVIVGVCAGLLVSPLGTRPGPMPVALMIPLLYSVLSFIPAAIGIVIGLIEIFAKERKTQPTIGLCVNTAYLVVFVAVVASMWETWMSV